MTRSPRRSGTTSARCSCWTRTGRLADIVTERDILRVIAERGGDALGWDLGRFAKDSVYSIDDGGFAYRALLRVSEKDIRHLAVFDDNGRLAGALTPRNTLNRCAEEMERVREELVAVARTLVAERLDPAASRRSSRARSVV